MNLISRKRAIAIALTASAVAAGAQNVTSVSGDRVTLNAGERQGVRMEMTGRFCKSQKIGGKTIDVCPATFRITSVESESSIATITRGQPSEVGVGFSASFDQRLVRAQPKKKKERAQEAPPSPPPRESDPVSLLADAEVSLDRGDSDRALDGFRRLLKTMRDDEYLARRSADAAQHVLEGQTAAPRSFGREETLLMSDISAASKSGHPELEKKLAAKLLALNPDNPVGLAVRAKGRALTWNRARLAAPWQAVMAWQDQLASFPNDPIANREIERLTWKTVEGFAKLTGKSCSEVASEVNGVPEEVRATKWFRAAIASAAPAWTCPFAGPPSTPASPVLKLVVVTMRQERPMPAVSLDISLPGKAATTSHPLPGANAKCSSATPCETQFAIASGEQYQVSTSGGSFRSRTEPLMIVVPPDKTTFCITQKMTRVNIAACVP